MSYRDTKGKYVEYIALTIPLFLRKLRKKTTEKTGCLARAGEEDKKVSGNPRIGRIHDGRMANQVKCQSERRRSWQGASGKFDNRVV